MMRARSVAIAWVVLLQAVAYAQTAKKTTEQLDALVDAHDGDFDNQIEVRRIGPRRPLDPLASPRNKTQSQ